MKQMVFVWRRFVCVLKGHLFVLGYTRRYYVCKRCNWCGGDAGGEVPND